MSHPPSTLLLCEGEPLAGKDNMDEWDDDAGANDEGHEDGPQPYHGRAYREAQREYRGLTREEREEGGWY